MAQNRPHYSTNYNYKRFLTHIVPRLQENETRSENLQYYYVFVSHEYGDLFDKWGRTPGILSVLQYLAEEYNMPMGDLFETVYIFTHSADAHHDIIDPLLSKGIVDMTTNIRSSKRHDIDTRYHLGLFETLSPLNHHMKLLRPRQKALVAASAIRDPRLSARVSSATEENPEAYNIIARIAQNKAKAAQTVRANLQNTRRPPRNLVRGPIASYMLGSPRLRMYNLCN